MKGIAALGIWGQVRIRGEKRGTGREKESGYIKESLIIEKKGNFGNGFLISNFKFILVPRINFPLLCQNP